MHIIIEMEINNFIHFAMQFTHKYNNYITRVIHLFTIIVGIIIWHERFLSHIMINDLDGGLAKRDIIGYFS